MADTNDVERQRQALLPQAWGKPLLHKLIDAVVTGVGLDDIAMLYAAACAEAVILRGPRSLCDEEAAIIAGYPGIVAAYRTLLDHLDAGGNR